VQCGAVRRYCRARVHNKEGFFPLNFTSQSSPVGQPVASRYYALGAFARAISAPDMAGAHVGGAAAALARENSQIIRDHYMTLYVKMCGAVL